MKTKLFALIVTLFVVTSVFAQTSLNNYKYVIVPNRFNFLKEDNQYRLNELAQFLFKKYGFTAIMEGGDYPEDLLFNSCLALRSGVIKESGMFKTKLKVIVRDCNDRIVYTSNIGISREKEYKTAYNKALRDAFISFQTLNYKYKPKQNPAPVQSTKIIEEAKSETKEEIAKLRQQIETLKKEKEVVEVTKEVTAVNETPKVEAETKEQKMTMPSAPVKKPSTNVLYAQAIDNGFQLVDSTPKVVLKVKNTGLSDVFLVEGMSAIIYKKEENWVLELYENNTLKTEKLNIKF